MIFKKGEKLCCSNYRGISIINSLAKIYDYVLCNRLMKWFTPDREQAGALPKRGCMEHIVTLRLIMDVCLRKRQKIFVTFVDFSKAYDRVPRDLLLNTLKRLGCGMFMLGAIASLYHVSYSIVGTVVISAFIGVRQGSPTSCFLFTVYVNGLIRRYKENYEQDGFLKWLHVLMLMDDTVILATTRERAIEKMVILKDFCESAGMVINESKTKFIAINGNTADREVIVVGGNEVLAIQHCDTYHYLGSIFTCDGRLGRL